MRTFRLSFALILLSCLLSTASRAQAVVEKDHTWLLKLGSYGTYESTDAIKIVTPSGNINVMLNFLLPLDHEFIQGAIADGPIMVEALIQTEEGIRVPCTVTFYPTGRVMVNGHLRGKEQRAKG